MSEFLKPFEDVLLIVLEFYHAIFKSFGGYGMAIIFLTLTVRFVLLPFSIKQIRSALEMQRIQPLMKELQVKYKSDTQKLQQETMKLFAEHKINPLSGCLPVLLQLPVFFALYYTLMSESAGLKGQEFLWISDLSGPDNWYILPALTVLSTYFSFKITVTDPKMMNIFMIMTLPMAWFAISFPAGVLIYWVTTNTWTLAQSYIMYAEVRHEAKAKKLEEERLKLERIEKKKNKKAAKKKPAELTED